MTRKITLGLSAIKLGLQDVLLLGNLNPMRDWGYAKDYVEGIMKILQYKTPEDFVLATGQTYSVRKFAESAARELNMDLVWKGTGIREIGVNRKNGKTVIKIAPAHFRPSEVDYLRGDSTKARKLLKWKPKVSFEKLVEIMVKEDYDLVKLEAKLGKWKK